MEPIAKRSAEELNLSARLLYRFITSDFESAWAALVAFEPKPPHLGRGNMLFARQAMSLLEFACRLYNESADARAEFSKALFEIDRRYFTQLPGPCTEIKGRAVLLPFHPEIGPDSADRTLLTALFDIVRHGLAHQYQSITVQLADGRVLAASVSGVKFGHDLGTNLRRELYLGYVIAEHDDVLVRLYPDVLYLDVKDAISRARLLDRGLALNYLERGAADEDPLYDFDGPSVVGVMKAGGHEQVIGQAGLQDA